MAANLIKGLGPVREKRMELEADRETIRNIVERGNEKARLIASETMRRVREAVKI